MAIGWHKKIPEFLNIPCEIQANGKGKIISRQNLSFQATWKLLGNLIFTTNVNVDVKVIIQDTESLNLLPETHSE